MDSDLRKILLNREDFKSLGPYPYPSPYKGELTIFKAQQTLPTADSIKTITQWTQLQNNALTCHGKKSKVLGACGKKYPTIWDQDLTTIPQFIDIKFNRDHSLPEKFIYQQSWVIDKNNLTLSYFVLAKSLNDLPDSFFQFTKEDRTELLSSKIQLKSPFKLIPNKDQWIKGHERVINKLRNNSSPLNKVVMARSLHTETTSSPLNLYNALSENIDGNHFKIYSKENDSIFMSFTPESFIQVEGNVIGFDSLAGTRARGTNEEEDKALENALLNDDKELREHKSVTDTLCHKLESYGEVKAGAIEILKLSKVQHLKTPITLLRNKEKTKLKLSLLLDEVITLLHPTPAVSGQPKEEAMSFLKDFDYFIRHDYAGLKGYIYQDNSELAVGIRSLKYTLNDKKIILYAGAGIVDGSEALKEWDETSAKMSSFFPYLSGLSASEEETSPSEATSGP